VPIAGGELSVAHQRNITARYEFSAKTRRAEIEGPWHGAWARRATRTAAVQDGNEP
jgi:hypothetical protein